MVKEVLPTNDATEKQSNLSLLQEHQRLHAVNVMRNLSTGNGKPFPSPNDIVIDEEVVHGVTRNVEI